MDGHFNGMPHPRSYDGAFADALEGLFCRENVPVPNVLLPHLDDPHQRGRLLHLLIKGSPPHPPIGCGASTGSNTRRRARRLVGTGL